MRCRLLIFLVFLIGAGPLQAWQRISGEPVSGVATAFDFEEKALVFTAPATGELTSIPVKDLTLRDRQKLLISPLFYQSFPRNPAWPDEKRTLLLFAVVSPVAAFFLGFWVAGIIVTRRFNPLRAFYGFLGGWILGILFVSFYLYFASRLGGGYKTVLFGSGLGLTFLSFYISAVYACDIFRGLLIFLLQIFFALFLSLTALFISERLFDRHEVERFWNERVFAPVGLIGDPNPFHPANSDSSEAR